MPGTGHFLYALARAVDTALRQVTHAIKIAYAHAFLLWIHEK